MEGRVLNVMEMYVLYVRIYGRPIMDLFYLDFSLEPFWYEVFVRECSYGVLYNLTS